RRADYGSYPVDVGTHLIKIRWLQVDTEDWKEKTSVVEVGAGETVYITITAE
ncbi:MAG: hypothetical protein GXO65_07485, partial [Euryarchaeota archaeon]|nr:hypothetical protein [Euryarchaeota archaeon]